MRRASRIWVVFVLTCLPASAAAQTRDWVGGSSDDWFDANNWSPVGAPGSDEDRVMSFGYARTSFRDIASSHGGSITITGPNTTLENDRIVYIGRDGTSGSLTISGGATMTITTPDAGWPSMYVGDNDDANGVVTVEGEGSSLTYNKNANFGYQGGEGVLHIRDGGAVYTSVSAVSRVGYLGGSKGAAIVEGPNSLWEPGNLFVGVASHGTLEITDGGHVHSEGYGYVGYETSGEGEATVSGPGASWTNDEWLTVGGYGDGTLLIEGGGSVSNTDAQIATRSTSTSSITVDSPNSIWTSTGNVYVGGSDTAAGGTGEVNVTNDATVTVDGTLKLWGGGALNLNGGTVRTGSLDNSEDGALSFDAGSLIVDGGTCNPGPNDFKLEGAGTPTLSLVNGATLDLGTNRLYIGDSQSGALEILSGSSAANERMVLAMDANSSGSLTIDGEGSSLTTNQLIVGAGGQASVIVQNGATLSSGGALIAMQDGSQVDMTIDGPNTLWTCDSGFGLGAFGTATVNIRNGATVLTGTESSVSSIDGPNSAPTTVTVTGPGTSWTEKGALVLGAPPSSDTNSVSKLTIQAGATVSDTIGALGVKPGSDSTAEVEGDGSTWTNSDLLVVGYAGTGTLNIRDGGSVSDANAFIGTDDGQGNLGTGTVTVDGPNSLWTTTGSLYLGGNYLGSGGSGMLTVTNGGMVIVDETLKVWSTGQIDGDGVIDADVVSEGLISPGMSAGVLSVLGDFEQLADGILLIELGGVGTGEFDVLDVTGSALLAGQLSVALIDDFTPELGDAFDIILAADIDGEFESYAGLDLGGGLWLDVIYGDSTVTLAVVPEPTTISLMLTSAAVWLRRRRT